MEVATGRRFSKNCRAVLWLHSMQAIRPSHTLLDCGWLFAAGVALTGCQPADTGNADDDNAADQPVVNMPAVTPVTPMDREALLLAVAKAASARAIGIDDSAAQRELEGQPLEFAIRFGCSGAAKDLRSAPLGWSYQQETLRVRAKPTITADDRIAATIGGEAVEAIEGFWVPLPWVLQSNCPANETQPQATAEPTAEDDQTADAGDQPSLRWPKIGVAQFFTRNDARTRRRDRRAYEAVVKVEQGAPVGSQGFNLVLSGRLRPVPGKRVIECVAELSDTPPDCVVSAHIDEVRIEQPEDGSVLARWSS